MKENKGITLLSLVVTITILLILVSVTIKAVGNNGLISVVKDTQTDAENSMLEANELITNTILQEDSNKGVVESTDKTAPTITSFEVTANGTKIEANVIVTDEESGIKNIKFSKDDGTTWENDYKNEKSNKYTFENLESGKTYTIKVKVEDNNGNTMEKSCLFQFEVNSVTKVAINTVINSNLIKNNSIIIDSTTSENIECENIVVKSSSNEEVSTTLNKYDIYYVTYSAKDNSGNKFNVVGQKFITKPTSSISLTNLISDSSFEGGTNDWYNGTSEIATDKARTGNKSFKFTVNNEQAFLRKNLGNIGIKGKNIYFRSYVYSNVKGWSLMYIYSTDTSDSWPSNSKSIAPNLNNSLNKWESLSGILDTTYTIGDYCIIMLAQGNGSISGSSWWDDLMAVDLTPFGSTVPTVVWLDEMLPYFQNTQSLTW